MDLSKVERRLVQSYDAPESFMTDMDLVFDNAKLFNLEGSQIHVMAQNVQDFFHSECAKYSLQVAKREKKRSHREMEV